MVGDLTPLEPAEEVVDDLTPLEPAEEVVDDLTPLEPAEEVVGDLTPLEPAVEVETKTITRKEKEALEPLEKEDPELLEGKSRVEKGTPKVTEITEKVTYEDGKEVSREEVSRIVIKEGSPEIKYTGTKKDTPVVWTVQYDKPDFVPSEEVLSEVSETTTNFKNELGEIKDLFEQGLDYIIKNSKSQSTKDFYQKYLDASRAKDDDGKILVADFLDYYRKSKDDTDLTLEDLVKDSAGKPGSIYETMVIAAADKIGVQSIPSGAEKEFYKQYMGIQMIAPKGANIYKDVMDNDDFGAYAPRQEAVDSVNKTFNNMKTLLSQGQSAFRAIRKDYSISEEETLAGSLEYYRLLTKQPEASLKDVVEDLANYSFDLTGAIQMVQHYDPSVKGLSDVVANYKRVMTTKQGHAMQSELDFFTKEVQTIIDGLGIDLTNV